MHKNNFYISFGAWLVVLPFLGIPGTWKNTLVFLSGLFLVLVSLGPTIMKRLQIKPKTKKKANKISGSVPSQETDLKFSETNIQTSSPISIKTETEIEKEL